MAKKREEQEYRVPSKKRPIYNIVRVFMKLLYLKPKVINLAGELSEKSIVIANHSAKSGPACMDLYYPKFSVKWGAYQMLGDYASRKAYLRDVLYIQKLGKKAGFFTSLKASLMAFFSGAIYRGMRFLPTYPDARIGKTLRNSAKVLDANMSVMIFPENSNEGYKDVLEECFPGFVMLAEKYYRATGEDVPVYPVYYSVKKRIMVIGEPMYVQKYVEQGMDRYQIAQVACEKINRLYFEHVEKA